MGYSRYWRRDETIRNLDDAADLSRLRLADGDSSLFSGLSGVRQFGVVLHKRGHVEFLTLGFERGASLSRVPPGTRLIDETFRGGGDLNGKLLFSVDHDVDLSVFFGRQA